MKKEPDFGTYHHTTPIESVNARREGKVLFAKAFEFLPFSRDEVLKILDVGCGLGFLSCVCAAFYPHASVVGFDNFRHESLRGSSLNKARENARILGFSDRVSFQKGDIFRSDHSTNRFDLIVSNLVYHNLGKRRFAAYEILAQWTTPRSFVVLGDIFFDYKADTEHLSNVFGGIRFVASSSKEPAYKVLVLSGSSSFKGNPFVQVPRSLGHSSLRQSARSLVSKLDPTERNRMA